MQLLNSYAGVLAAIAALTSIVALLLVAGLNGRMARQSRMLRQLLSGPEGADLEALLKRVARESAHATTRGEELEIRLAQLSDEMRGCVQRVGFVRYDAYPDVSGRQSFSLALLDGRGNGTILTGLFGRSDGRSFGKAVVDGRASAPLSDEETRALEMAMTGELPEIDDEEPVRNGRARGRGRR
jgi:hypothetical protein